MYADHLDPCGQITECGTQMCVDRVRCVAGHGADVDVEFDVVGDRVGLRAAVDDVRREGRVGAGVETRCDADALDRVDRVEDPRRVEQRSTHLALETHGLDLTGPGLGEHRVRAVVDETAHHL